MATVEERLAAIQAQLEHVVKQVDKADDQRDTVISSLSAHDQRLVAIERHLPEVKENMIAAASSKARVSQEKADEVASQATTSIRVAFGAMLIAAVVAARDLITGG